jgi:quercetin dioxygenase-like cupin family protein
MSTNYQITNQATGQVIKFIKNNKGANNDLLEMETVYAAFSDEPPLHYHPVQKEVFKVLAGELTVRMNAEIKVYKEGEEFCIEPGVHHSMWNSGYLDAMVSWIIFPPLETESFLNTLTSLANEGKTNEAGVPALPLMLYLLNRYRNSFRLSKLGKTTLSALCFLLYPLFLLMRYRNKIVNVHPYSISQ